MDKELVKEIEAEIKQQSKRVQKVDRYKFVKLSDLNKESLMDIISIMNNERILKVTDHRHQLNSLKKFHG